MKYVTGTYIYILEARRLGVLNMHNQSITDSLPGAKQNPSTKFKYCDETQKSFNFSVIVMESLSMTSIIG